MSLRLLPAAVSTNDLRFTAFYCNCSVLAFSFTLVMVALAMGNPYFWFCRWPAAAFLKALRAVGLVSCSA
jgi:hypothetical protein